MPVEALYAADAAAILSHRHDNGDDWWTTPDRRLLKGAPFSTLECALMLLELGMDPAEKPLAAAAQLFFGAWREDGRFKLAPSGGMYPCHTAHAADLLCRLGYADDERLQAIFRHLLDTRHTDGGWRCLKFSFGRGPETESSTPLTTLLALDAFRYSTVFGGEETLDDAVDFLLEHWVIRRPISPCHYGIGTLFMQVEYPMRGYNLFSYVYTPFFLRPREARRPL